MIWKLLAEDPDDRYQTADGVAIDLRRLAGGAERDFNLGRADHLPRSPRLPLLGRDREVGALVRRWRAARAGAGGVGLIEGSAGSGKSRLVAELMATIRAEGGLVLTGECEAGESVPLAPLRLAITDHLHALSNRPLHEYVFGIERIRAAARPAASLLRGLAPALDDGLQIAMLHENDQYQQVLVAVADFLAALAVAHGGALLCLDDVQLLDPATRQVLRHLARKLADVPMLVVLAGRDDGASSAAMALVSSALGAAFSPELRLHPLPVSAVAELASFATGGMTVDLATAGVLTARCRGNAFTLLQYLDALVDGGLLHPHWGQWRLDLDGSRGLAVADDGVDLILRRLDGIDEVSRSVLGVAAVHGSVFDYHLAADACGLPRHRVLDVAGTAAWQNLVERRPDGRYGFRHDRIREALVAQYEPQALRGVHQRLADVLSEAGATDPEGVFALARHCVLGEPEHDPGRTVAACHAAGRLALANHAPTEAVRYLELAEATARAAQLSVDSAFLLLLGTAQQQAGHFTSAARSARTGYERSGDPVERARLLSLLAQSMATSWNGNEQSETIMAALRELGRPWFRRTPLLVISALWTVLRGLWTRLLGVPGTDTLDSRTREAYQLEASLCSDGMRASATQLKPLQALLYLLRQTYPVVRIGPGAEQAQLLAGFAAVNLALGRRRSGRRYTDRAVAAANATGDPIVGSLIAAFEALTRHAFGFDQGAALRSVMDHQCQWLDLGTQSDLILVLLWDALHRGDIGQARRLAERRATLIANTFDAHTDAVDQLESTTVARATRAILGAWAGRPEVADSELFKPADDGLANWELFPLYGTALAVAYQQYDLGHRFDELSDRFDALRMPTRGLLPVGVGFFLYRAQGRVEQYRSATGPERRRRRRQARAELRRIGRITRTPMQRTQVRVARAGYLQAAGKPRAALELLARLDTELRALDAPLVDFDAARVRALALRDLQSVPAAGVQAQIALDIANRQGWLQQVRRMVADFELARTAAEAGAAG
jgi:ABC-type cobalamin transport system ATPase subunit